MRIEISEEYGYRYWSWEVDEKVAVAWWRENQNDFSCLSDIRSLPGKATESNHEAWERAMDHGSYAHIHEVDDSYFINTHRY
jgi:hypothetical protein